MIERQVQCSQIHSIVHRRDEELQLGRTADTCHAAVAVVKEHVLGRIGLV